MKDPEKIGFTESANEDIDDMLVASQNNPAKLQILLQFFKEIIEVAKPYTNSKTGKIRAPNNVLPLKQITLEILEGVHRIDGAFAETISYTTWIQTLYEGMQRIQLKIQQSRISESGEKLK